MFYPPARDAIAQFIQDQLPPTIMMRTLLAYHDWICPGQRTDENIAPSCIEPEQSKGQRLLLFTDAEAFQRASKSGVIVDATSHFKLSPKEHHALLRDVHGVWINVGSPQALKLENDQFKTYRDLADGLDVERCLAGLNENPDFNGILRKYRGWWIVLVDGESKLLLVPDAQGRQFAAAFTALDAVDAAVSKLVSQTEYKNPAAIPMTGHELFTHLKDLEVAGINFNCAGPIDSHSFSLELATEVLDQT
jgi:hypothetical protein